MVAEVQARPDGDPRWRDLARLSWREWRHHPARHAAAAFAVALGVALASSVHWINRSALAEFAGALRSTQGEPDLVLRAASGSLPDTLFDRLAGTDGVQIASPVLELDTYAQTPDGARTPLRVRGVDALRLVALAPALLPHPAPGEDPLVVLDPDVAFVNAAARDRLGLADGGTLVVQTGGRWVRLRVAGGVAAAGPPLAVLDIAGAQARFDRIGTLSRIDLRLAAGADPQAVRAALVPALPPGVRTQSPADAEQRATALSRAYRVNLTVLAMVALLVGAFLVYSVVALSVAQRTPALALLGVLGLGARERRALVLGECAAIGALGSAAGLALGVALAAAALRWLAGDLGGGYFPAGAAPALRVDLGSALAFGALGTATAVVGGAWPARQAERLAPAQALKGLGTPDPHAFGPAPALAVLAAGVALAFVPPIAGLPLAAYAAVACLLFGGVALVPTGVGALLRAWPPPAAALPRLALRRAHWQRHTATAAVAGVVASLALSTALTVMVTSFRDGVASWLDRVLPADLYVRSAGASAAAGQAWLDPAWIAAVERLPGVARVQASRVRPLSLAPTRPDVTLIARPLGADPSTVLPLRAPPIAASPGETGVFVSEAVAALYGATPGATLALPLDRGPARVRVRGVWRDYARQFGAIAIDVGDYRRLTGDTRVNDLAVWLAPGAEPAPVQAAMRAAAADPALLEVAGTAQIRALSLRIFDRSFAVTRYLQAVAIGVGLVGVAAALSAQVLARRKEFGLLAHLGLTRRQVVALVAGEAAAWLAVGCAVGLALGVAISVVLVEVVNPQSFHWTMPLVLPAGRLVALAAAVALAGVVTAAWAARRAAGVPAVRAVQEDW